jgi:hypothetical protein
MHYIKTGFKKELLPKIFKVLPVIYILHNRHFAYSNDELEHFLMQWLRFLLCENVIQD